MKWLLIFKRGETFNTILNYFKNHKIHNPETFITLFKNTCNKFYEPQNCNPTTLIFQFCCYSKRLKFLLSFRTHSKDINKLHIQQVFKLILRSSNIYLLYYHIKRIYHQIHTFNGKRFKFTAVIFMGSYSFYTIIILFTFVTDFSAFTQMIVFRQKSPIILFYLKENCLRFQICFIIISLICRRVVMPNLINRKYGVKHRRRKARININNDSMHGTINKE